MWRPANCFRSVIRIWQVSNEMPRWEIATDKETCPTKCGGRGRQPPTPGLTAFKSANTTPLPPLLRGNNTILGRQVSDEMLLWVKAPDKETCPTTWDSLKTSASHTRVD